MVEPNKQGIHSMNTKTPQYSAILCVLLLLALCGCAGQVETHEEAVERINTGEKVEKLSEKEWAAAESQGLVDDGWLQTFNDPTLTDLVEEAEKNNYQLKVAAAQVDKANALAAQSGAALKPSVGLAGGYADRATDGLNELYGGGLKVSWEADVWGRIRSGVAGAEELADATRSDFEFARQSLAATTAGGYFTAIGAKLLTDYSDEIVQLQEESVRIAETKENVGQGSAKDVHLARANLATAQDAARQALSAQETSQRSLELMLGRYPSAQIETADTIVAVPPPVSTGIPSELLERRPDLIAAEQRVAAAFYKQKEAELLHLPRFSFSIGLSLNNLTDAAANLAAGLFAPLYTGGAIEAEVAQATAAQNEAIAAYAQTALNAFNEVETALANEEHLLKREEYLQAVVSENLEAYKIMQKQYDIGQIEYLDVLTVQNKWIQAQIALINTSTIRLINRVQLHLALGGSFDQ